MQPTQCAGRMPDGGSCPWTQRACQVHAVSTDAISVVYYLGDPDSQLVKIGTSTALKNRIYALRFGRPRVILLATEPGSYPLERARHYEFRTMRAPLLTGETEWFRKTPQLMEHVGQLRQVHGILCPGRPIYRSWVAPLRS